ncbi:MAG TPA: DUF2059 domain-containing protein [Opitutaceae bacterium]|jgi:hypothetical protein
MVKSLFLALGCLATATLVRAADGPELHGMIVTSEQQRFLISASPGAKSDWVGVGEEVGPWKVTEFRAKDQILVLKQADGTEQDLSLVAGSAKQGAAPGTVEEAQHLFEHMHFQEMMTKVLAQQKLMLQGQMRQQAARYKGPATKEEYEKFQDQVLDKIWSGFDMQKISDSMAKIYSETFSSDDLNAMADFYDTPAGQDLMAKQPQVTAKLMPIMQQQMMPQMAAVQQMTQEFNAAHAQPSASAPAPAAGATTPPKAP